MKAFGLLGATLFLSLASLLYPSFAFAGGWGIDWRTPDELFQAQSLTITINGKQFRGAGIPVLSSRVISNDTQNLHVSWNENGVPMKMDLYFTLGNFWKLISIKTTDGVSENTYVSYDPVDAFDQPIMNGLGEPYINNGNVMTFRSNSSNYPDATIRLDHLTLNAFLQDSRITQRPQCAPSSIPPATGTAPLSVTLFGGGSFSQGVAGYQWSFAGNGLWDSATSIDPARFIYTNPGTFYPQYLVWGANNVPSVLCTYAYPIVVSGEPIVVSPTPTVVQPTPTGDDVAALKSKVAELENKVNATQQHQIQQDSILGRILSWLQRYFPFFR